MIADELAVLDEIENDCEPHINYKNKYSDEFYKEYVNHFQQNTKNRFLYRFVKRTFDIIVSFWALIVLILPFVVIAICCYCHSH